ncbi:MAG: hypothetical protein AB1403_22430, partial [Candidatus Riflebacteria bacterium]
DSEKATGKVAEITQVMPVLAIYRNRKNGSLTSSTHKAKDIANHTLPPRLLFKKFFNEMVKTESSRDFYSQLALADNHRQLQQMFKSLTPTNLIKNKVSRNFSSYLGGEIFFLITEMPEESRISHAFFVFRGRDIQLGTLIKNAMQEVKNADILLRRLKNIGPKSHYRKFLSGEYESEDGLSIIKPANQLFTRFYLHNGGTKIVRETNVIPFIRYRVRFSDLQSSLAIYRPQIKTACLLFIIFLSTIFLRLSLFGFDFSESLKSRVLAGIMLAAIFPMGILAICLYFYHSYELYISRLNIEQHMEIKIAQNSEQLIQSINEYETFFSSRPLLFRSLQKISPKEFSKVATRLGEFMPFSEASLISSSTIVSHSFPERCGVFNMSGDDPIWSFFPTNIIKWLKEDGRENRVPQHIFLLAGQQIKASSLNDAMLAAGGFYLISQGAVPIMVSSVRIPDPDGQPGDLSAILHFKYELGPLLKSYFDRQQKRDNLFYERSGNYEIRYGFFPMKLTSNNDYWQGSLLSHDEEYFSAYRHLDDPQTIYNNDSIALIRINNGFAHKIIAVATPIGGQSTLSWSYTLILGLCFMLLILVFASLLLDQFFLLPILSMANSAEKIARGNDEWALEIKTGDELAVLNQSFSEMVSGLKQRNALKNYVSADAFSEIEKNCNIDLYPGGEHLDVSVMFATIKGF